MTTATRDIAPIPWFLYSLGLVMAVMSFVAAWLSYDSLPDPMPIHFNASGEADGFVDKSLPAYLGIQVVPLAIILLSGVASAAMISVQARSVLKDKYPQRSTAEREVASRRLAAMQKPLAIFILLITAIIALTVNQSFGLFGDFQLSVWWTLAAIFLATGWLMWTGSRVNRQIYDEHPDPPTEERFYGGVIYFNRNDERVFIDQLGGTNLTLNFARPMAWVVLAALLLPGILIAVLVSVAG